MSPPPALSLGLLTMADFDIQKDLLALYVFPLNFLTSYTLK